jgi:Recombinase
VTTVMVSTSPRRPGRPPCCPRELAVRIIQLRQAGLSYAQICTVLNAEHIPTPMGRSRWLKSHVDRLLHTRWVEDIIRELHGGSLIA